MKTKFWIHAMTLPVIGLAYLLNSYNPAHQLPTASATLGAGFWGAAQDRSEWQENDWRDHIAAKLGGEAEHRLPDGSRVDILTEKTAWELDWTEKHPEAVGQALFYAISTNRRPGIILLGKGDRAKTEENYLEALAVVAYLRGLGIDFQLSTSEDF